MASAPLENVDEAVRRAGDRTPDEPNGLLGVHTRAPEIPDGERLAAPPPPRPPPRATAIFWGVGGWRPIPPATRFPLRPRDERPEEPIEPGSRPIVGP